MTNEWLYDDRGTTLIGKRVYARFDVTDNPQVGVLKDVDMRSPRPFIVELDSGVTKRCRFVQSCLDEVWKQFKVGTVWYNKSIQQTAMVIAVDSNAQSGLHVKIGDDWYRDEYLSEWGRVND